MSLRVKETPPPLVAHKREKEKKKKTSISIDRLFFFFFWEGCDRPTDHLLRPIFNPSTTTFSVHSSYPMSNLPDSPKTISHAILSIKNKRWRHLILIFYLFFFEFSTFSRVLPPTTKKPNRKAKNRYTGNIPPPPPLFPPLTS